MKKVIQNIAAPTPSRWKKVAVIAGAIAGVAGVVLASPFVLPTALVTGLTVTLIAGTSLSAIAGSTKKLTAEEIAKMFLADIVELINKLENKKRRNKDEEHTLELLRKRVAV